MGNRAYSAGGGTGSGFHGIVEIPEEGSLIVTVGKGGTGYGAPKNSSPSNTDANITNGGSSIITLNGTTMLTAGGGGRGYCTSSSGTAGSAGVLGANAFTVRETYFSTNGSTGSLGGSISAKNGPYSGHTYGGAGKASGGYNGSWAYSSYHGYFFLKYLGPK